jgi:hypothetical protein
VKGHFATLLALATAQDGAGHLHCFKGIIPNLRYSHSRRLHTCATDRYSQGSAPQSIGLSTPPPCRRHSYPEPSAYATSPYSNLSSDGSSCVTSQHNISHPTTTTHLSEIYNNNNINRRIGSVPCQNNNKKKQKKPFCFSTRLRPVIISCGDEGNCLRLACALTSSLWAARHWWRLEVPRGAERRFFAAPAIIICLRVFSCLWTDFDYHLKWTSHALVQRVSLKLQLLRV